MNDELVQQQAWPPQQILAPVATCESEFWSTKVRPCFENGAVEWQSPGPNPPVIESFKDQIRQSGDFAQLGLSAAFSIAAPLWASPTSVELQTDIVDTRVPAGHAATVLFGARLSALIHQDGRVEIR